MNIRKICRKSVFPMTALLLQSCAYVNYSAFEGQSSGPVSAGAFVDTAYSLPIYKGNPPKPYQVLGFIEASERQFAFEGTDHAAVRVAKSKGADAVICIDKNSVYAGTVGGSNFNQNTYYQGDANAKFNPYTNSVTGNVSGSSTSYGYGSMWTSVVYLQNANYIAIKWR